MENLHSNAYHVLNHSSHEQFMIGLNWYSEARQFSQELSAKSGRPFISVCAALSALSPMSPWERNKLDCQELCLGNTQHKFTTFSSNVEKAKQLLNMDDYSAIVVKLNGLKTIAFFDNIFNPESDSVTIDSHMVSIAYGRKLTKLERPALTSLRYSLIEDAIRNLAHSNNLRPYELQAILWVTWRDLV